MSNWHGIIDGLRLAAAPSRTDKFMVEILETRLQGVHFDDVDEEDVEIEVEVSPTTDEMSSRTSLNAGSPRLVSDGAGGSHIAPARYQWIVDEIGCDDHAAMEILAQELALLVFSDLNCNVLELRSNDNPFKGRSGELKEPVSEAAADGVVRDMSHSQCLKFLYRIWPNFMMKNLVDKEAICSALLNMAEHVEVLPPGNEPLPWDVLNMTLWRDTMCEFVKEMKTVEEQCPLLLLGTFKVYVLTNSPYSAFLRALAAEIADCRRS